MFAEGFDLDVRIDVAQPRTRGVDLRLADVRRAVEDLALQVAAIHEIEIDDPECADAGRGEIERRGRSQTPRADQQDACVTELRLALETYIREREVPRVPQQLLRRQRRQFPDATPAI